MKTILYSGFCAILFCFAQQANAQLIRYQDRVFAQIDTHNNIQYAMADPYDAGGSTTLAPLHLDIYEPTGDTATLRPVVLVFYGGSFIGGSKNVTDIVAWCDSLAHYGYVAVAPNYRLGFNFFQQGSVTRAGYRALQDSRAAVRYIKEMHATYKIDTNKIFMVGNSAGAITALQCAYSDDNDRPAATYGIPGSQGDVNDLGCMDCSGNSFAHDSKIKAVVGLWGAVLTLSGLTAADQTAALMFHGDNDNTVPIDSGYALSNPTFPIVYGSRTMSNRMNALGVPNELHVYPGLDHNFYYDSNGNFPNAYWDTIFPISVDFLCQYNALCDGNTTGVSELPKTLNVQIYPNPASDKLNIVLSDNSTSAMSITLYNIQGIQLQRSEYNAQSLVELSTAHLPTGMYLIQIQTEKGRSTQKFSVLR